MSQRLIVLLHPQTLVASSSYTANYLHGCHPPLCSHLNGNNKGKFVKEPEKVFSMEVNMQERHGQWSRGGVPQTTGEEGEMITRSVDRQGQCNLLISQSRKKATRGECDWISFKSTSRSIELAVLINEEWGRGAKSLCRYGEHHSSIPWAEQAEETGGRNLSFLCWL